MKRKKGMKHNHVPSKKDPPDDHVIKLGPEKEVLLHSSYAEPLHAVRHRAREDTSLILPCHPPHRSSCPSSPLGMTSSYRHTPTSFALRCQKRKKWWVLMKKGD